MGDLSEGLAGSPQKAIQMANSAFKAVNKMNLKVPFIMTKGNHDITGPGAKEAFEKVYLPNMARLAGHPSLQSANYTTTLDDVLFVCYDPWDRNPEGLQQLEKVTSRFESNLQVCHVTRACDSGKRKMLACIPTR